MASARYLRRRQIKASNGSRKKLLTMPPKKPLMTTGPYSGMRIHSRQVSLFEVLPLAGREL